MAGASDKNAPEPLYAWQFTPARNLRCSIELPPRRLQLSEQTLALALIYPERTLRSDAQR